MSQKTARTADYLSIDDLKITLTWPFQISNPLDFRQTTFTEYQEKQKKVKKNMEELSWQYLWEIPEYGGGPKYAVDSGGTGKAYNSPYYLECSINCNQIKHSIEKYNFLFEKIKIKFYEFGFATVSASCTVSLKSNIKVGRHKIRANDFLRILNKLDDEIVKHRVGQVKALVSGVTKKFNSSIKENGIVEFFKKEKILNKAASKNINSIKSLHRIIEYKVDNNNEIKFAQKALNKIAKLSNGEWESEKFCSHFVGVANSIIIYNFNIQIDRSNIDCKILEQYRSAYETVLETANAYYFIAEYIKNGLFDYSRESIALKEQKKIFKKQKKFNEAETGLNEFIFLTSNFSSIANEFIVNLNPQRKNIWEKIDKVWNTSKTTKMLQDQLQNSLHITDRVFTQTAKKRQKLMIVIAVVALVLAQVSFQLDIWNSEGTIDAIVKVGNFLSANLIAIFIVAASFALICFVGFVLKKLRKRRKEVYSKNFILVLNRNFNNTIYEKNMAKK